MESISLPQQLAVTATGIVWSRYAFAVKPVNYSLFAVNACMAGTGFWHLSRIARHRMGEPSAAAAGGG